MKIRKLTAALLCAVMLMSVLASCALPNLSDLENLFSANTDSSDTTNSGDVTPPTDSSVVDSNTPEDSSGGDSNNTDDPIIPEDNFDINDTSDATSPEAIIKNISPDTPILRNGSKSREAILYTNDTYLYTSVFMACGYKQKFVNNIAGAKVQTSIFTNDKYAVTFHYQNETLRVIWESVNAIGTDILSKTDSTGLGSVTISQIGIERGTDSNGNALQTDNPLNGLCYIIKTDDGRAIIVDGGFQTKECADNIYNTLKKLDIRRNADDKFEIAAWIITHAHEDHIGAFISFAALYGKDNATVEYVIHSFPGENIYDEAGNNIGVANVEDNISQQISLFEAARKSRYPYSKVISPHANLNYYIDNVTISMLYSPELIYEANAPVDYFNNTSLAFKIGVGNTNALILGDAAENAARVMNSSYSSSAFKCNILQITHHAMFTGANYGHTWTELRAIYDATNASLALLPLHSRYEGEAGRNGRFTMLSQWTDSMYQISYVTNEYDVPNGWYALNDSTRQDRFTEFEKSGTVNGAITLSLYGYDGTNVILNENGLRTYLGGTYYTPMVTTFSLSSGVAELVKNEELYVWLGVASQPDTPAKPDDGTEPVVKLTIDEIISSISGGKKSINSGLYAKELILANTLSTSSIEKLLKQQGFALLDIDNVDSSALLTSLYLRDNVLFTLHHNSAKSELRLIYEEVDITALKALTTQTKLSNTGSIQAIQLGTERNGQTDNPLNGMTYIYKLSDGRAIIVDGGHETAENANNIFNTLKNLNITTDEYGKYKIAAWIVTHNHGDHTGGPLRFAALYNANATIEYIINSFPGTGVVEGGGNSSFDTTMQKAFPEAILINPHANVKYYIGNAVISMMYTPELLYKEAGMIAYFNDTSLVFKVECNGASVFQYGDSAEAASEVMRASYSESCFKSTILQITHHGLYTQANYGHKWDNLGWVYAATEAQLAFLPLHSKYEPDARNGRYTVMGEWCDAKYQISYVMNEKNIPDAVAGETITQAEFNEFELYGTVNGIKVSSLHGYNGRNIVVNENGMTTYLGATRTTPMITIFNLSSSGAELLTNEEVYTWLP